MSKYSATDYRQKLGGGFKKIPSAKIAAWVEQNFDYKTRKGGSEYTINSPFDSDIGHNFNISPEKGVCHDWRGNEWAGPANPETGKRNCSFIKFVRIFRKCSYRDALKEVLGTSADLSSYMRPEGRVTDSEAKKKVAVALPAGTELLATSADPQANILIKWLATRGYTPDDIEKTELHHLGMDVYWPYYEFDTLVYWQSRSRLNKRFNFPDIDVRDKKGNIVGETEGSKGDFLYGFDDVESASYLIITEAIFDKHTLRDQALASGGAALTPRQVGKIKILGPRKGIILSPDNDKAGIKSILENHSLLKEYKLFYSLPPALEYVDRDGEEKKTKDWNEIGQFVLGFDKVRGLHDERIRKLSTTELVRLRRQLQ